MRRLLPLLLLVAPWAGLPAQSGLPRAFAVDSTVALRIWVPAGSVRLETWDRDSIRVTGTVAKGSRFFGGGAGQAAKLGVDNSNSADLAMARGDLVVTVPRAAHVWIKMTEGSAVATGTTGELEIITVAGTISVRDAAGVVAVETIDAAVTVQQVNGAVRVRSGGGAVTLTGLQGTVTAATVGGRLELVGQEIPDARLETIGGTLSLRGTIAQGAIVTLDTHSGPILLALDPARLPSLGLTSLGGQVSNPLGKGSSQFGRVVAHSFKGAINVQSIHGIEGRKPGTPP